MTDGSPSSGGAGRGVSHPESPAPHVTEEPAGTLPPSLQKSIAKLIRPEYVLVGFLLALVLFFTWQNPVFLGLNNFRNVLLSVAVLGILAVPSTLLLVSANVDLSVASNAAFCGMVVAIVGGDYGIAAGVAAAVVAGTALGAFNGFLVAGVGINSIITTLGTLAIFRGMARLSSNGQTVRVDGFTFLGSDTTFGLPHGVIVLVIVAVTFYLVMRYTVFGRSVYAIGSNPHAARLSGIRLRTNLFLVFTMTGLCAALAGLILTSQLRAGTPVAATGLELSVVAAVLLGGASLTGGRGTVIGTILGVLILGTLNNGMTILNVSSFWQEIARGSVLIIAVGLDQLRIRLSGT